MENVNQNEHDSPPVETTETPVAGGAESTESEAASNQTETVTESNAVIKIEGQEFEIEAALAQDDKLLKTILQPHFAAVENANITREVAGGKLTVSIVKRAQHKG